MSAALAGVDVDPATYRTFVRILATRRPGTRLTADTIRDELAAAQLPPQSLGAYFKAACHGGLLRHTGFTVPSRQREARGRRLSVYVVTTVSAASGRPVPRGEPSDVGEHLPPAPTPRAPLEGPLMAREYARIRVDIWSDDDFRALPQASQLLYLQLLSSPTLTYCGVADWRPARIAALGASWGALDVVEASIPLRAGLFIVVDEDTEEVLLRSFLRHDGVLQQARVAVTMAKAHAGIASATIRGVVVHELRRLHEQHPDWAGWRNTKGEPGEALAMLRRHAIDPAALLPEDGGRGPVAPHVAGPVGGQPAPSLGPTVGPPFGANGSGVWGSASTPATPAPTPTPAPSPSLANAREGDAPPPRCAAHRDLPEAPPCPACRDARLAREAWDRAARERATAAPTYAAPPCPEHPAWSSRACPECARTAVPAGPAVTAVRASLRATRSAS